MMAVHVVSTEWCRMVERPTTMTTERRPLRFASNRFPVSYFLGTFLTWFVFLPSANAIRLALLRAPVSFSTTLTPTPMCRARTLAGVASRV